MSGSFAPLNFGQFQVPDIVGMSNAMQTQSLNAMREQQLMGAEQERGNIRRLMATPDFDISSPDAPNRLLAVAPTTGAAMYHALQAGHRERRQAQVADLDRAAKLTEWWMNRLNSATPENWPIMRAAALRDVPNWAPAWPEQYSPDAVRRLQSNAADSLLRYRNTVTASPAGGFVVSPQAQPYGTEPLQGPRYIPPESIPAVPPNAPAASPAGGPAAAIPTAATEGGPVGGPRAGTRPGMTPGQIAAANFLRGAEDYRGTPYYDVTAYRAGYGSDTTTLADGRVVPARQGMTVSREDAERDLARRIPEFTQRAAADIGRDRFEALPPNAQAALISIAYNYGHIPESIRASARSGDLAALSRDVAALAANPSRRRQEAAMIAGGAAPNAMVAPGAAAPANAMLAPPDATVVQRPLGIPEFPGLPRAANLSDADLIKRIRDIQSKEAEARMQADLRRENAPDVAREKGTESESIRRGQLTAEQERKDREKLEGRQRLESVLRDMNTQYERLTARAGIPSESRSAGANIGAFAAGTAPGQMVGRALATPSQTARNQIESLRNELLQAFKAATGMGSKEADSNADVQRLMSAMSDTTMSIESVRGIMQNFSKRYGLGELNFPETAPAAPPGAAPAAPSSEGIPPPRRGAAPPTGRPTLEQFLERARPANPNASIEDLTAYYNRTYGGR